MTRISPRVCSALLAVLVVTGCQKSGSKSKDDGRTYTPAQKGGATQSESGGQTNKPLNSPAETVNGMASPESDSGNSQALKGQAVAEPGAPVEHEAKPTRKSGSAPAPAPQ